MITDCVKMYDYVKKEKGRWTYEDKEGNYFIADPKVLQCGVKYNEFTKEQLQQEKFNIKIPHSMEPNKIKKIVPASKFERTKKEADKFIIENKEVERYQVWYVMNGLGLTTAYTDKDSAVAKAKEINDRIINDK